MSWKFVGLFVAVYMALHVFGLLLPSATMLAISLLMGYVLPWVIIVKGVTVLIDYMCRRPRL